LKEKPLFFCDNCGQEVNDSAKTCPYCGRFFASVRCPACGFSGEDKLFVNGCPSCGYSASPITAKAAKAKHPRVKKKPPPADPLPIPVYIFSVIAFLAVLAILSYVITR